MKNNEDGHTKSSANVIEGESQQGRRMEINPLTPNCKIPYHLREHICFGISPYNSLFSEEYIGNLIGWGLSQFSSVSLFLPDEPTFYTLEALGYSEDECRKKMKKQLNWLKNKINKAVRVHGLTPQKDIRILDWETLTKNEVFNQKHAEVFEHFDGDENFRNSCLEASKWVLQSRLPEEEITQEKMLKAVKYFLSEIPLFSDTNRIVGSQTSIFCYHQAIDFHAKLYSCDLNLRPATGQGYGLIT